jgi:tetratricopeptide (TPR) repeat protein
MLCPFCLKEGTIKKIEEKGRIYYICSEHAFPTIPITYAENEKLPRDVISAIGFRTHGKSAYFASLFASLDDLARVWPGFCTFPVDEKGLETVNDNVKLFKGGKLPERTPSGNFGLPTIVQFSDMPKFKDRFLIFYDTSGENYERASSLINNANFVKRSQTAIFFMSLYDLEYNTQEMHHLLAVYIQGLKDLGGNPKEQHLLVVLTKGDLLAPKLESHKQIWEYLVNGDVNNLQYSDIKSQMAEMKKISKFLKEFLREDIGANNFMALSEKNFRSVEICIISALGAAPKGDQLDISATPKRIFDPILWVMNNSTGLIPFFFKLMNSSSNFIKSKIKAIKTRTSTKKETVIKKPNNYRNTAKYGAVTLILALIILFVLYPNIFPKIDFPQLNPISPPDPYNTAVTLQNEQKYQDALNAYENVPATNPNYIYALTNKGNILTYLKRYDEALIEYNKALAINPNYQSAIDGKKKVQEKIDTQNPETVKQTNNLKIQELIKKGEALVEAEQYQEALDIFDQALAIGTTDNNIEKKLLGEKVFVLNKMGRVLEANKIAQTLSKH